MPTAGHVDYLEAAPGPQARKRGTLVLLHAFPLNARMWDAQLTLADRGWHVIAPQARGAGASGDTRDVSSIDDYAADVVDLLDSLHVKDAVVAGLSMGGYVALALLRLAPTYLRGLILADTKAEGDTPEALEGRRKMLKLVEEKGVGAVADELIPKLLGETTRRQHSEIIERVRALAAANSVRS